MNDGVVFQHCQRHRQSDAVVGTQRGATGFHPAILSVSIYGVVQGVFHAHTDHVHVIQQHDGFCTFVPLGGRFTDDYAVLGVTFILQVQSLGKLA